MSTSSIFCSGLFPYTFRYPDRSKGLYAVIVGVFTHVDFRTSQKQFFYSKSQLSQFLEGHRDVLDLASTVLLTTVLCSSTHLPDEANNPGHTTVNNELGVFFVLAHCVEKLPCSSRPSLAA